jgi:hypothetical protein
MGAANMTKPGAELIAWYLNLDRLPVSGRWSRRHADNQRRLCQRFAVPVIGAVACQDITVSHTQKIVNAGVIAVMDVSELTGYSRAGAAGPNVTAVARVNPVPVVVTIVPPADVARRL